MNMVSRVFLVLLMAMGLSFAEGKVFNKDYSQIKEIQAIITTHEGEIVLSLDFKAAPNTVANFVELAKSSYQSVKDLIANRAKIKSAVVQSNAVTTVEIAGDTYTVAEAIERKNSIRYDKALLDEMKSQYAKITDMVTKENNRVDAQVDKMLETFLGKDSEKKVSETDLSTISDPYRAKNEWELIDPLNLYEKIQTLESAIDAFEADVDVRLSISNSVTYIEV